MKLRVEELTAEAFSAFGAVLGSRSSDPDISDDVHQVWLGVSDLMGIGASRGRQVTHLRIHTNRDPYNKLEKHETSAEAFIPLLGRSVLVVVPPDATLDSGAPDLKQAHAFYLDGSKGVLLKPATWHALPYLLDGEATFLVLVDDAIIEKGDLHITPVEPIEFDLSGVA